jgi:hypothetical protein
MANWWEQTAKKNRQVQLPQKGSGQSVTVPKVGDRFGRLTVVSVNGTPGSNTEIRTKCDCGGFTRASIRYLRSTRTRPAVSAAKMA